MRLAAPGDVEAAPATTTLELGEEGLLLFLGLAQRLLGLLDHLLLLGEQVDHRSAVLAGLLQPLDGRALECDDALVLKLLRVDLGPLGVDLGDGHLGEVHGVLLGLFLGVPLLKHTRSCEYNFS